MEPRRTRNTTLARVLLTQDDLAVRLTTAESMFVDHNEILNSHTAKHVDTSARLDELKAKVDGVVKGQMGLRNKIIDELKSEVVEKIVLE